MEEGKHAINDIVGIDVSVRRVALLDVRCQIAVREHRRFRRPGCTAGEHVDRNIVRIDVQTSNWFASQQLIEIADSLLGEGIRGI